MLSIAPADALNSDALWVLLQALAEVRVARDALDGATGDVLALSHDAEWRSDGVTSLRDTLRDLATRTRVAAADAAVHETRIASVSA